MSHEIDTTKLTVTHGVYVLRLNPAEGEDSDNYYIGMSRDIPSRIKQHIASNGALWTKKYGVKGIIKVIEVKRQVLSSDDKDQKEDSIVENDSDTDHSTRKGSDGEDHEDKQRKDMNAKASLAKTRTERTELEELENRVTAEYMFKYGVKHVRGGYYTKLREYSDAQIVAMAARAARKYNFDLKESLRNFLQREPTERELNSVMPRSTKGKTRKQSTQAQDKAEKSPPSKLPPAEPSIAPFKSLIASAIRSAVKTKTQNRDGSFQ